MSDMPNFEHAFRDPVAHKASLTDRLEDLQRREPALLRQIQWCQLDLARATNDYTTLMWLISIHRDELKSQEDAV